MDIKFFRFQDIFYATLLYFHRSPLISALLEAATVSQNKGQKQKKRGELNKPSVLL